MIWCPPPPIRIDISLIRTDPQKKWWSSGLLRWGVRASLHIGLCYGWLGLVFAGSAGSGITLTVMPGNSFLGFVKTRRTVLLLEYEFFFSTSSDAILFIYLGCVLFRYIEILVKVVHIDLFCFNSVNFCLIYFTVGTACKIVILIYSLTC